MFTSLHLQTSRVYIGPSVATGLSLLVAAFQWIARSFSVSIWATFSYGTVCWGWLAFCGCTVCCHYGYIFIWHNLLMLVSILGLHSLLPLCYIFIWHSLLMFVSILRLHSLLPWVYIFVWHSLLMLVRILRLHSRLPLDYIFRWHSLLTLSYIFRWHSLLTLGYSFIWHSLLPMGYSFI